MIKCEICGKEYKTLYSLSKHFGKSKNHPTSEEYYNTFLKKDGEDVCQNANCTNKTKYFNLVKGYHKHCSQTCSNRSIITQNKSNDTKIKKYGTLFPNREKYKKTMIERHGAESPLQVKEINEKRKQTNLKKYGVEEPFQAECIKDKTKLKNLENLGVEYPIQCKRILEKTKQTNLKRYGHTSSMQCEKIKNKIRSKKQKTYFDRLIDSNRLKDICIPNFKIDEYINVDTKYEWICNICNNTFVDSLSDGHIPRCLHCYPKLTCGISNLETEVCTFVEKYYKVIKNNRHLLDNLELDIYIPEINLAIEFDGLYWHSELNGKNKNYHLNKTKLAQSKGIQLIHIFEDEWINQQDIVKSILLSKMGKLTNKIYARKCIIKEVPNKEAKQFLCGNHLQGEINGKHFGLYFQNELVSLLSMGKSRYNKKYDWEILRFCNKNYTTVVGGLSKLLSYFRKNNPGSIISYVDRRYGDGHGYEKIGFNIENSTKPTYYYFYNGQVNTRENRLKYQKHKLKNKLEIYDPNLSEWHNMVLNKYNRVWDCGNYVYTIGGTI